MILTGRFRDNQARSLINDKEKEVKT